MNVFLANPFIKDHSNSLLFDKELTDSQTMTLFDAPAKQAF